jgi:hypothetical protein
VLNPFSSKALEVEEDVVMAVMEVTAMEVVVAMEDMVMANEVQRV